MFGGDGPNWIMPLAQNCIELRWNVIQSLIYVIIRHRTLSLASQQHPSLTIFRNTQQQHTLAHTRTHNART